VSRRAPHYVYILQCADSSYYVGSTEDISKRIELHAAGRAAVWTSTRLPVQLVYHEVHESEASAIRRERQLKGWTRAKKKALIFGNMRLLKQLAGKKPVSDA
jgi:putative endonuclease